MKLQSYLLAGSLGLCVGTTTLNVYSKYQSQKSYETPPIPNLIYGQDGLVESVRVKTGRVVDAICFDRKTSDQALSMLDEHPTIKGLYNGGADQVCLFTVENTGRINTNYIVKEGGIIRLFLQNGNRFHIVHRSQT